MKAKSLTRLLQIKQRQRQIERSELADADKSLEEAERVVDSVHRMRATIVKEMAGQPEIGGAELALRAQLAGLAQRELAAANVRLQQRKAEREACGERVIAATQEVRVFEHLNDRARLEHERAQNAREQIELDELSARKRGAL